MISEQYFSKERDIWVGTSYKNRGLHCILGTPTVIKATNDHMRKTVSGNFSLEWGIKKKLGMTVAYKVDINDCILSYSDQGQGYDWPQKNGFRKNPLIMNKVSKINLCK